MTGMPKRLSRADCFARLTAWASCGSVAGGELGATERVVADYLRQALCHLGIDEGGTRAGTVHVHRLLASVRRHLHGWIPDVDEPLWVFPGGADLDSAADPESRDLSLGARDVALRALRRLTLIGDCAHGGEGYYLPTPPRLVPLPSGRALVIGGLPTRATANALAVPVGWAGLARGVPAEHLTGASSPRLALDAWLSRPPQTLAAWTEEVLVEAQKQALPSPGLDPASFEVYAPHLQANQGQINRWMPAKAWRASNTPPRMGLAICRTRTRPRRFWLAPLASSPDGPAFNRESLVPPRIVRRLMYGFDQLAGATVVARVLSVVSGLRQERELRLFNWPAREEYQLLAALAYDTTPPDGPFLPIRYRVATEWWPDVRTALEGLSIRIKDETGFDT